MTTSCLRHGDDSFGPQVNPGEREFDFTLLFEQGILSAAPSALFISFVFLRAAQLRRVDGKTLPNMLRNLKLVTGHPQNSHQITAKNRTAYHICVSMRTDRYFIGLGTL